MKHALFIAAGLLATVAGLAQAAPDLADLERRVTAIEERLAARPLGTATVQGMQFQGRGNAVSEPFALPRGVVIIEAKLAGEEHAAASQLSAPGTGQTFSRELAAGSGDARGIEAVPIHDAGSFVIFVEGTGAWIVTINAG
ncbi:MAG: hypothetical protein M3Q10_02805 [Chloroflexota bacterium]|nr:hypothetical protein [Chloroflexota bacterium]